jgi:hypothetical protein
MSDFTLNTHYWSWLVDSVIPSRYINYAMKLEILLIKCDGVITFYMKVVRNKIKSLI